MRILSKDEIKKILEDHAAWQKGQGGTPADLRSADLRSANLRSADLSYADLSYANLRSADLRYADLRYADLRYADLRYANLDFSTWPLYCGGLNVKIDKKIAIQLLYHAMAQDCDDPDYQALKSDEKIIAFLKGFHREDVKKYWEK